MRNSKLKNAARCLPLLLVLFMGPLLSQSCATNHLMRWAEGEPSYFSKPYEGYGAYVRPAGLVLGAPLTVAWDVLTLPFQYVWQVFPYGTELSPEKKVSSPTVIQ
jgi:hypothetical protein